MLVGRIMKRLYLRGSGEGLEVYYWLENRFAEAPGTIGIHFHLCSWIV
jgi:hypothetical protein